MSETVERRLIELLDHPTESPYGNPIPGLDELGETGRGEEFMRRRRARCREAAGPGESRVHIRRISEEMQKDEVLMGALRRVGALPDKTVTVAGDRGGRPGRLRRRDRRDRARGRRAHLRAPPLTSESATGLDRDRPSGPDQRTGPSSVATSARRRSGAVVQNFIGRQGRPGFRRTRSVIRAVPHRSSSLPARPPSTGSTLGKQGATMELIDVAVTRARGSRGDRRGLAPRCGLPPRAGVRRGGHAARRGRADLPGRASPTSASSSDDTVYQRRAGRPGHGGRAQRAARRGARPLRHRRARRLRDSGTIRQPRPHRLTRDRPAPPRQPARNSLHPTSSRHVASGSPRVAPRLTITTGAPALAARCTNRSPLITVSDEPATSSAPPESASASTAA